MTAGTSYQTPLRISQWHGDPSWLYIPPAIYDLESDLLMLQREDGLSVDQIQRTHEALRLGEGNPHQAREHIIAAIGAMDSAGGRALYNIFNVDGVRPLPDQRRREYAEAASFELNDLRQLEEQATKELTLRLLGRYYRLDGTSHGPIAGEPAHLTSRIDVSCLVRDRRVVEIWQLRTIIPIVDGMKYIEHRSAPDMELLDVPGGEIVSSRPEPDGHTVHQIRLRTTNHLDRDRQYEYTIRERRIARTTERLPKKGRLPWNFDEPVLKYRLSIQFAGEQPTQVRYHDEVGNTAARSPKRGQPAARNESEYRIPLLTDRRRGTQLDVAWKWRQPPLFLLLLAVGLLAGALFDWPAIFGWRGTFSNVVAVCNFITLLCFGVTLIYRYCARWNRREFKNSHRHNQLRQVPDTTAAALQYAAAKGRVVTSRQAQIFALAILKPRLLRQRVIESYELGRRSVRQKVTVEVQIPRELLAGGQRANRGGSQPSAAPIAAATPVDKLDQQALIHAQTVLSTAEATSNAEDKQTKPAEPAKPVVYFPVVLPVKANFPDGFAVKDSTGETLPMLSYREYLQLAAAVLRLLLATPYRASTELSIPVPVKKAERQALTLISSRRTATGIAPDLPLKYEWWENIEPGDPASLKPTIDFVQALSSHYAMVTMVQPDDDGRFTITYEQTLIPDLTVKKRGRLNIMVGARPIDLSINIKAASTCQSYHLQVNGPEDLYLGEQELVDCAETLKTKAVDERVPPHYRFRRRLGQPYAHFYARLFPEAAPATETSAHNGSARTEQPRVRLKYLETPPGSLLRAAVSAIACLLLVSIVGIVSSHNEDFGSDAPAFLLAFPALVAAWLGFESPSRHLLEGTFAARASLLMTVTTSISASGLFMAHRAIDENNYEWWRITTKWAPLWISDISWLGLTFLAALNAVTITFLYIKRTAYFAYLAGRPQGSDLQQHG